MEIKKADEKQLLLILEIAYSTIKEIYPRYYPKGAVEFFLSHHNERKILEDITSGKVYYMTDDNERVVGTVTVNGDEICRLFVLPKYQKKGCGSRLIAFAEEKIFERFDKIVLDASLPAKRIYLKKGYFITSSHEVAAENGDVLCYDVMEKFR